MHYGPVKCKKNVNFQAKIAKFQAKIAKFQAKINQNFRYNSQISVKNGEKLKGQFCGAYVRAALSETTKATTKTILVSLESLKL